MADYLPVYIYFVMVGVVALLLIGVSSIMPADRSNPVKYMPYESGIQTETNLLMQRFPLRHYLVALIFLVFDIEVIFLYPWAVIGKELGPFAFYEMAFFMLALLVGFTYVWRKKGLQWE